MSCEHLVCASCAGPVSEGRCASCRAHRAAAHSHGIALTAPTVILLAVLVLLAALWVGRV